MTYICTWALLNRINKHNISIAGNARASYLASPLSDEWQTRDVPIIVTASNAHAGHCLISRQNHTTLIPSTSWEKYDYGGGGRGGGGQLYPKSVIIV